MSAPATVTPAEYHAILRVAKRFGLPTDPEDMQAPRTVDGLCQAVVRRMCGQPVEQALRAVREYEAQA